jgi:hypothetical protein
LTQKPITPPGGITLPPVVMGMARAATSLGAASARGTPMLAKTTVNKDAMTSPRNATEHLIR